MIPSTSISYFHFCFCSNHKGTTMFFWSWCYIWGRFVYLPSYVTVRTNTYVIHFMFIHCFCFCFNQVCFYFFHQGHVFSIYNNSLHERALLLHLLSPHPMVKFLFLLPYFILSSPQGFSIFNILVLFTVSVSIVEALIREGFTHILHYSDPVIFTPMPIIIFKNSNNDKISTIDNDSVLFLIMMILLYSCIIVGTSINISWSSSCHTVYVNSLSTSLNRDGFSIYSSPMFYVIESRGIDYFYWFVISSLYYNYWYWYFYFKLQFQRHFITIFVSSIIGIFLSFIQYMMYMELLQGSNSNINLNRQLLSTSLWMVCWLHLIQVTFLKCTTIFDPHVSLTWIFFGTATSFF